MPGINWGMGLRLELGWVKIMNKQSRIDGSKQVNLKAIFLEGQVGKGVKTGGKKFTQEVPQQSL